jgi:acetoin utilization protein AcuB
MTPNPISGDPQMPVTEAQEIMIRNGFGRLPIVDEENKLVGLVTRKSLLKALPSDVSNFSRFEVSYVLAKIKARDVMVTNVITIDENIAIEEAARIMADKKIGCLPVMREGDLVGIITDNDLFTIMVDLLGAWRPGVRVTVRQPDRAGEVARLTTAIAKEGGYLSVCVGYYSPTETDAWFSVCKVVNIPRDKLVETINLLEDTEVQDVREV